MTHVWPTTNNRSVSLLFQYALPVYYSFIHYFTLPLHALQLHTLVLDLWNIPSSLDPKVVLSSSNALKSTILVIRLKCFLSSLCNVCARYCTCCTCMLMPRPSPHAMFAVGVYLFLALFYRAVLGWMQPCSYIEYPISRYHFQYVG